MPAAAGATGDELLWALGIVVFGAGLGFGVVFWRKKELGPGDDEE